MDGIGRRDFVRLGAMGASSLALGCQEVPLVGRRFKCGVASADPRPTSVRLWTHVADTAADVVLKVEVARDEGFTDVVWSGDVTARAERGHAVEVEATGLAPGQTWFYRFEADDGEVSLVGRTRTAPEAGPVRLAFTCCASYAHGWLHTYRRLAERNDLDAVVHLGDYIYEYGDGAYGDLRGYDPPHEVLSLDDYRRRHAHYRRDPDCAALHAQHPLIVTWDDHELANDAWAGGSVEHDPASEGDWLARRAAATQAYREWLPRSEPVSGSLYRELSFGPVADLFVLDTRIEGRDPPPASDAEALAPGRSILGVAQRERLLSGLRASAARWKVVAHGVQLSPHHAGFWNLDAWDGYAAERDLVLAVIDEERIDGVVFVCGDGHKSFADDLPRDPLEGYDPETGAGSVAVEIMTPAASSPNFFGAAARALEDDVRATSPHTKLVEAESRGYWVVDLDEDRVELALSFVDGIELPEGGVERLAARFEVRAGERFLRRVE